MEFGLYGGGARKSMQVFKWSSDMLTFYLCFRKIIETEVWKQIPNIDNLIGSPFGKKTQYISER